MNAVRHHLKELESEGLLAYEREHRGVGAPVFAYFSAAVADVLLLRRYRETLEQLLDAAVARDGRAAAAAALESHFDALGARLELELVGAGPAERMAAVVRALSEAGYMAEGEAQRSAAAPSPSATAPSARWPSGFPRSAQPKSGFSLSVLGGTIERRSHMLQGCGG